MWNLKKQNQKTKFIDTENRLVVARGGRWEVGQNGDKMVKGYKLLVIRLTSSGCLIYSKLIIANNTALYLESC